MKSQERKIVQMLQEGKDIASIAEELSCSAATVKMIAGKFLAVDGGLSPAERAKRRMDQKSYHVTMSLNPEETSRLMVSLPREFPVTTERGESVFLVMDHDSFSMAKEKSGNGL